MILLSLAGPLIPPALRPSQLYTQCHEIKMYNSVAPYKPHKYELARPLNNERFCTKSSGTNSILGLSLRCSGYAVPFGKLD